MKPIDKFQVGDVVKFNDETLIQSILNGNSLYTIPKRLARSEMTITEVIKSSGSFRIKEHPTGGYSGMYWTLVRRPKKDHFDEDLFEL